MPTGLAVHTKPAARKAAGNSRRKVNFADAHLADISAAAQGTETVIQQK